PIFCLTNCLVLYMNNPAGRFNKKYFDDLNVRGRCRAFDPKRPPLLQGRPTEFGLLHIKQHCWGLIELTLRRIYGVVIGRT
ncbi:MAG: hypothetical protein ACLP2X_24690, partial [Syntrophobacteraceae bacterium]